jgi:hypothetical protein
VQSHLCLFESECHFWHVHSFKDKSFDYSLD